jgi:hypothetical protein
LIVIVRVAVPSVVPLELRSVIVKVAVPARSARICHATLRLPPAATVATDCVNPCGLRSRSALLGVKLTTTDRPLAAAPPVLVTIAVAVNDWPREMVAGTPLSAIASADGDPLLTVKRREADQLPATPAEFFARTRHQCWTAARPLTLVCDAEDVRLLTSGAEKLLLSST